ncbi:hypothetical protein KBD09_03895 [Candidatus Woesebacteria bacterium]|nr:hypothetical protein [Candidatus Woesebacteria bacterium]
MSKSYICISLSDFPYSLFGKTPEEKFRSLEKYLEKNSILFDCEGEVFTIFAKDEFEARMIGTDFRLKSLRYYQDGKCVELSLVKVIPKRQPRLKKSEKEPGEITSLKELRKIVYKEKAEGGTTLVLLKKRRILTQAEFKKGIKDGIFHPFVAGGKIHIPNIEIQAFLNQ